MLNLLYFARLREAVGVAQESISPPPDVLDVQSLMAWLAARGGIWQQEFAGGHLLRAAINQELAGHTATFKDGDEIAFFPPVTGG